MGGLFYMMMLVFLVGFSCVCPIWHDKRVNKPSEWGQWIMGLIITMGSLIILYIEYGN